MLDNRAKYQRFYTYTHVEIGLGCIRRKDGQGIKHLSGEGDAWYKAERVNRGCFVREEQGPETQGEGEFAYF